MDHQARTSGTGNTIVLPAVVVQQALDRAQDLGIDLSSYIQTLISDDLLAPVEHAWLEPLPAPVSQQYSQDLQAFLTIEIESPQPSAQSGQALADLLDQEIESLADG